MSSSCSVPAEDSLCAIAEKLLGQLEVRAARNGYQRPIRPGGGSAGCKGALALWGPGRRQVDRAVEQALANQIASGTAHTGQHWTADCTVDGAIVFGRGGSSRANHRLNPQSPAGFELPHPALSSAFQRKRNALRKPCAILFTESRCGQAGLHRPAHPADQSRCRPGRVE